MRLIDPLTGCVVETCTDKETARLMSFGYKPEQQAPAPKPKRTSRRRKTTKE